MWLIPKGYFREHIASCVRKWVISNCFTLYCIFKHYIVPPPPLNNNKYIVVPKAAHNLPNVTLNLRPHFTPRGILSPSPAYQLICVCQHSLSLCSWPVIHVLAVALVKLWQVDRIIGCEVWRIMIKHLKSAVIALVKGFS